MLKDADPLLDVAYCPDPDAVMLKDADPLLYVTAWPAPEPVTLNVDDPLPMIVAEPEPTAVALNVAEPLLAMTLCPAPVAVALNVDDPLPERVGTALYPSCRSTHSTFDPQTRRDWRCGAKGTNCQPLTSRERRSRRQDSPSWCC